MAVDLLVFAAHPDDAEMAAGGLIAKMTRAGRTVGIVDLTRGELGSRGTPEERAEEAAAASEILGVSVRENLGLPDGGVVESLENRKPVVDAIRRHRPTLVIAPHLEDAHPDHAATGRIVESAMYPSGFANYDTGTEPYRPAGLAHCMHHYPFDPSFVVDISDVWEQKMEAVRCYGSQLHREGSDEPVTNISRPDFLDRFAGRFRHYGFLIGAAWGEPFWTRRPVPLPDPVSSFGGGS
jgi:bacillithiol biosynthesis deacetylase BshB1